MRHLLTILVFLIPVSGISEQDQRPRMKDFIGINGHTVQFKPELYQPVARLVRDYHPISWDLGKKTSELPPLPFAKNKVNWESVYGSWKKQGWTSNACLMFGQMTPAEWENMEADARAYGRAIAHEFGPSGKRRLLESVEIGNEPGKWSDAQYQKIFRAMAGGLRAGDEKLKIATCNITAGPSGKYEKSVQCIAKLPEWFDVLTIHSYAQLEGWPTWKRSYPEDPKLPRYLKDIEALCAWRDKHMPDKPVWITEFGYDSTTLPQAKSGTFKKWEGVTDAQQAQWIVRSLLVFSSMPVERAYIYFFNDSDQAKVHASAGLTRDFKPKPSFHAVSHLQKTLGDFRFHRVVTKRPGKLRVHEYVNGSDAKNKRMIWAVWSPTREGKAESMRLTGTPGRLLASSRMPLDGNKTPRAPAREEISGEVVLEVTGSPAYLVFGP